LPMAERAGLFEEDLDLSGFAPRRVARAEPAPEAIREVSERVNFQSREPTPKPAKRPDRRHRTGRSEQLNLKVRAETRELFYRLNDSQGWVQGYTFERAVQALQKELEGGVLTNTSLETKSFK